MIPRANITAWRATAPWPTDAQVEQDLALSRAIVEIFADPVLNGSLAFRGGTALHKLYLTPASRYSEDIDLVQIEPAPIGPLLTALRRNLDQWLGASKHSQSQARVTLVYRFESDIPPVTRLRLKVEVNTREHFCVSGYVRKRFTVSNPWFEGSADLMTYTLEELLGTKLRALYQRKQGRDVFDLAVALQRVPNLDAGQAVLCFLRYLEHSGARISRAEFEANLADKLADPMFLADIAPLVVAGEDGTASLNVESAVESVMVNFIERLPGAPWKRPG